MIATSALALAAPRAGAVCVLERTDLLLVPGADDAGPLPSAGRDLVVREAAAG